MKRRDGIRRSALDKGLSATLARIAVLLMASFASAGSLAGPVTKPVPAPATARVTIMRSQEGLYGAIPATIDLNGRDVAVLRSGQIYSTTIPIGPVVLTVSASSMTGQSSLRFDANPGDSYDFIVLPRTQKAQLRLDDEIVRQLREGRGPFIFVPVDVD